MKNSIILLFRILLLIIITMIITLTFSDKIKKEINNLKMRAEYYIFVKPKMQDDKILDLVSLDQNKVDDLYQMLKDTIEIFEIANIKYSADGGTLLGAVRHKGLIPWDDDVDITLLHDDEIKFAKLQPIFEELGYGLDYSTIIKIYKKSNSLIFNKNFSAPFIDIMIVFHDRIDNKIKYVSPELKKIFPKEWFPYDKYFPLKKCEFGPIKISCTNDPEWYLKHYYGSDWEKNWIY